jgi:hypothetical protein
VIEIIAWAVAVMSVVSAVWAWVNSIPVAHVETGFIPPAPEASRHIDVKTILSASAVLRDRDPFRVERAPTSVRFGAAPVTPSEPAVETRPERPKLVLAGIVGGPPWMALVEGVPGREGGVILVQGETMNGIRLDRLWSDSAALSDSDTTWVLSPKRVWR